MVGIFCLVTKKKNTPMQLKVGECLFSFRFRQEEAIYTRGGQAIFGKGQILGFAGHATSVLTTQLCVSAVKSAFEDMQMNEHHYIPIKLQMQTQVVGWMWPGAVIVCRP